MHAGEVCSRDVVFVRRSDQVIDAARLMREHHVGCLVVIEDQRGRRVPTGMLTDRDVVVGVVAQAPDGGLTGLTVGDVVTRSVVTALEDETLHEVVKRMRANGVRRVPVVAADGSLVGLLSVDDILDVVAEELTDVARLIVREQRQEERQRP
jgi:CBS domain-containing protein